MTINAGNFDLSRTLFTNAIFVIPTFQRPYAWEDEEFDDLIKDIKFAATCMPPFHYLSPIHVIKIDNPGQPEWSNYTDPSNTHIALLNSSRFIADDGGVFDVYLVVDGQQRLTTLFMLFYTVLRLGNLMIEINGNQIPKIILNPTNDHYAFCGLLGLSAPAPTISSMSQTRLSSVFKSIRSSPPPPPTEISVINNGLKTLLIELDVHYGLRGFLTLNDRGKDLTFFEKLKSLIMEYDLSFGRSCSPHFINTTFGHAYHYLDKVYTSIKGKNTNLISEEELISIFSIDIWRIARSINESQKDLFERYRATNPGPIVVHNHWLNKINEFTYQISQLTDRLNGIPAALKSIIYCSTICRNAEDHYKVILDSLSLSRRSMAILLKFRALFPLIDWHDKKFSVSIDNSPIIAMLNSELNDLIKSIEIDEILADDMRQKLVNQYENDIAGKIENIKATENRKMSLLDLAEWIEILIVQMGSNRDFIGYWSSAFNGSRSSNDVFYIWTIFATNYYSRRKLFSFLLSDNVSSRSKILYHFLAEYESNLRCVTSGSTAIIPHNEDLDIEHFLPSGSTAAISSWPYCGFKDDREYWIACGTLGNMLLLDASLNRSIRDQIAPVKLTAYRSGIFASTTAKTITEQSKEVDRNISSYGLPAIKYYLRLRRLDLLVFLIGRF